MSHLSVMLNTLLLYYQKLLRRREAEKVTDCPDCLILHL